MKKTTRAKLPITQIFVKSIKLPITHFLPILRVGWPVLLIIACISTIAYLADQAGVFHLSGLSTTYSFAEAGIMAKLRQYIDDVIANILGFLLFSPFVLLAVTAVMATVGCHRIFILNRQKTKSFRWSDREFRFVGWFIVVSLCSGLVVFPIMFGAFPVMFGVLPFAASQLGIKNTYLLVPIIFGASYCFSRWILLLPATAVDERHGLSWAWGLSHGNGSRLTILLILIPLFFGTAFEALPKSSSIWYSIILGITWLYVAIVEIGFLSLSYKWLVENNLPNETK